MYLISTPDAADLEAVGSICPPPLSLCRRGAVQRPAVPLQFPLASSVVASVVAEHQSAGESATNLDVLAEPIPPAFRAALKAAEPLSQTAPTPRVMMV